MLLCLKEEKIIKMEKTVIILFSRQDLTHLFGRISPSLSKKFKIIHVAYCYQEEEILKKYSIKPDYILTKEIQAIESKVDLEIIDELISNYSNGKFNFNSASISDRTLENYNLEEIESLVSRYYTFWTKVLEETQASIIFHEIVTHLYNHLISALMKKYNKYYFGLVPVFGLNDRNFKFIEYDNGMLNIQEDIRSNYYSKKEGIDLKLKYREKLLRLQPKKFIKNTWIYIIKIIINDLYRYLLLSTKIKKNNDPNNYWIIRQNQGIKKLKNKFYSLFFEYNKFQKENNYYYFPLHVEPESVLSHWSSGTHEQYSLIEQICRALPVKTNLIIKEHWADPYNADIIKLKKLKKIHNLIIVHPKESSLEIIQNSCGVISINGTSLFEAYILNKRALMLGNNYYDSCNSITKIKIENLRGALKNNDKYTKIDNNFIQLYEETNYSGNISQYFNGVIKNNEQDINNIVNAISELILKIKEDK